MTVGQALGTGVLIVVVGFASIVLWRAGSDFYDWLMTPVKKEEV